MVGLHGGASRQCCGTAPAHAGGALCLPSWVQAPPSITQFLGPSKVSYPCAALSSLCTASVLVQRNCTINKGMGTPAGLKRPFSDDENSHVYRWSIGVIGSFAWRLDTLLVLCRFP
jgi:hypothetical protein